MPKRISKEEFDARFGKRRFSEQELFERGLSTDPNGQVRPTTEVFNDLFIDGVNRLGLSHPEAKARANSYFGRITDPRSHTQAGPELQSLVTKAQASPPPPADILNAPTSPAAQRVRTEAQLDDDALGAIVSDLGSMFGEVDDFYNPASKKDWVRAKQIADNIESYQYSLNNTSAFGGSSKPYPLSPQDSQFISDFFKKQMIYDDGAGNQVYGREGDAEATRQFYDLLYDLEVGSGKNTKTRRQVSDELDAKRFAEEEALFAAEQAAKATPVQKQVTDDIWSDNSSIDPRNIPVTPDSVSRTDPWGGGSVPPDQVSPSSRQPYIYPEDLQLAVRMLNEAKETKSPTGNRMGMKFSPELIAALLVPSAVVSPLVLDEIGKPKPKDEKALQKTY